MKLNMPDKFLFIIRAKCVFTLHTNTAGFMKMVSSESQYTL